MAKQSIQIAIFVEGGIVTAVLTDASQASIPINVTIVDYDTDGAASADIHAVLQDNGSFADAFIYEIDIETDPDFISRVVGRC